MLPSIEQKLMTNTSFKQLVVSAIGACIKSKLDELTITRQPAVVAEQKVLDYCREKMKTGSILNHNSNQVVASDVYVIGMLSLFDDMEEDDIVYTLDEQGAVNVDWDQSKSILVNKIVSNGYLFGLAGCLTDDFATAI